MSTCEKQSGHISIHVLERIFSAKENISTELPFSNNSIIANVKEREATFGKIRLRSQEEAMEALTKLQSFGAQGLCSLLSEHSQRSLRVKSLVFAVQDVLAEAISTDDFFAANKVQHTHDAPCLPKQPAALYKPAKGDPLAFLEKHWGDYLSYFRAPKNILYQYQLRKFDECLCNAVRNRLNYLRRKDKSVPRFQDIVPPKKEETNSILSSIPEDHLEKIERVACRLSSRQHRQK